MMEIPYGQNGMIDINKFAEALVEATDTDDGITRDGLDCLIMRLVDMRGGWHIEEDY